MKESNHSIRIVLLPLLMGLLILTYACNRDKRYAVGDNNLEFGELLDRAISEVYVSRSKKDTFYLSPEFINVELFQEGMKQLLEMEKYTDSKSVLSQIYNTGLNPIDNKRIESFNKISEFKIDAKYNEVFDYNAAIALTEPTMIGENRFYFYMGLFCKEVCYKELSFRNVGIVFIADRIKEEWIFKDIITVWGG